MAVQDLLNPSASRYTPQLAFQLSIPFTMSTFTRYAAVAAVVISLGFLVAAAPTPAYVTIPAITGDDAVSLVCAKLAVDIQACFKAIRTFGFVGFCL